MQKKLRLFYYNHDDTERKYNDIDNVKTYLSFPTVPLYLDSYIKECRTDLLGHYEWVDIEIFSLSQHQLIEYIENNQIDILLISLYVWNIQRVLPAIKNIKSKITNPNFKIIAGGPSVSHNDLSLLQENLDIDYAVYGQGEQAFADLLDIVLQDTKPNLLKHKNIMWRSKSGKINICDYQMIKRENSSPYLESQDLIKKILDKYKNNDVIFNFAYGTSRGCVYKCTFCDWQNGLDYKMYKRKIDYEAELDFLGSIGLTRLMFADSNFGMYPIDLDIAKIMAKLKKEKGYDFFLRTNGLNFSKLNKKRNFEIYNILRKENILKSLKISVQDIHPEILENIARPDVPWDEHLEFINEFKNNFPDNAPLHLELIIGLPGQTRKTWITTLKVAAENNFKVLFQPWVYLANSPAAKIDYQIKMKLSMRKWKINNSVLDIFTESYSYNFRDWLFMAYALIICIFLGNLNEKKYFKLFLSLADKLDKSPKIELFLDHLENEYQECVQIDTLYLSCVKFFINEFNLQKYLIIPKEFNFIEADPT